jgi:energy-coupling factor transport system ATP-binding protein
MACDSDQKEIAAEAIGLSFGYEKDVLAINDVSFKVVKGEYLALIGHNGSGKSTLARLLSGLLEPLKGTIRIFGTEMTDDNVLELRKNLGIVFQNPDNQFIGATVREDIAFGLENDKVPPSEMETLVDEYAKKVGMYEYLDKEPSSLSGGQKQRVAIAGVLARHPQIMILDEATSMLDPKGKREILELISLARQDNKDLTVISITHDIEEASRADHVVVLNSGRIALDGTSQDVFGQSEVLTSLNLDIPFCHRLAIALKKQGIDVGNVSSLDDLVSKL